MTRNGTTLALCGVSVNVSSGPFVCGLPNAHRGPHARGAAPIPAPVASQDVPPPAPAESGLAFEVAPVPAPVAPVAPVAPTPAPAPVAPSGPVLSGGVLGYAVIYSKTPGTVDAAAFAAAVAGHAVLDTDDVPGRREHGILRAALAELGRTHGLQVWMVEGADRPTYAMMRMQAGQAAPGGVPSVVASDEQCVRCEVGRREYRTNHLQGDIERIFARVSTELDSQAVAAFVNRTLRRVQAISWRDAGGAWFAPAAAKPVLDALTAVLGQFSGRMLIPDLSPSASTATAVREAANAGTLDVLGSIKARIEAVRADIAAGTAVREGTLDRLDGEIRDARETALAYKDIVGLEMSEIERLTSALQADTDALYGMRDKARAARK